MGHIHLTDKQEAFCREYVIDCNGAQAAIRAGYAPISARVQACKMLTKDNILDRIGELQRKIARETETEAAWVRRRLKEEADEAPDAKDRVKALEIVAKINGIIQDAMVHKGDPSSPIQHQHTGTIMILPEKEIDGPDGANPTAAGAATPVPSV